MSHESEAERERRAGMFEHNDGLGGHDVIDSDHMPHHNNSYSGDDYEDYHDEHGRPQRRRRESHGSYGGGGYEGGSYGGSGRPVVEGPTNVIYEAPQHNTHDAQGQGYQGVRRNPMGNLVMFIILIAILVFGYMTITHTSFDQLIHMLTGNHTTIIVQTK